VEHTNSWHDAFNRLERRKNVIDAFFDLADAGITVRSLSRRAWTTHRWDTRPARRPLKITHLRDRLWFHERPARAGEAGRYRYVERRSEPHVSRGIPRDTCGTRYQARDCAPAPERGLVPVAGVAEVAL
jgi:hypothetical protein